MRDLSSASQDEEAPFFVGTRGQRSGQALHSRNVDRVFAALRREQETIAAGGYATMTAFELFEANCHFHETLAAWSGNRFILQGVRGTNRLRRLIEYRNASQGRGPRRAQVLEHLEILDAVAANDRKKAAALMRAHLAGALREKVLPDNLLA